jgi:hypothetical protein
MKQLSLVNSRVATGRPSMSTLTLPESTKRMLEAGSHCLVTTLRGVLFIVTVLLWSQGLSTPPENLIFC